jgi:hypothetical protein
MKSWWKVDEKLMKSWWKVDEKMTKSWRKVDEKLMKIFDSKEFSSHPWYYVRACRQLLLKGGVKTTFKLSEKNSFESPKVFFKISNSKVFFLCVLRPCHVGMVKLVDAIATFRLKLIWVSSRIAFKRDNIEQKIPVGRNIREMLLFHIFFGDNIEQKNFIRMK